MEESNPPTGPREVADLALETSPPGREKGDPTTNDQVQSTSCSGDAVGVRPSSNMDAIKMVNIVPSYSYHALHTLLKEYGTVLRIRLIYEDDFKSNRCYVTFASSDEAQLACNAVASLPFAGVGFEAQLLRSSNISDSDMDYVPNIFEDTLIDSPPRASYAPPPRWFIAYYRGGRGNFIKATRLLAKEIGTSPEGYLKKYGKGVLVRAKDITQAKMLENLPCPADGMFESIKAHNTFNYKKGVVYNHDLYEFSEEEVLKMCPSSVHKAAKMKGSTNMILLTFFGSTLPDYIHIGPLNLRVKPFGDRPLQCFSCYRYGHGKKNCTERPRCGNCSALDAHSTAECEADAYCFHCQEGHQLRSRQCPQYRLEQDILQLANSQFISFGSARRELLYRQKTGTGAKTYASSLGTRSLEKSRTQVSSSTVTRPSETTTTTVTTQNRFSALSGDSGESPLDSDVASPTSTEVIQVEVHAPNTPSSKKVRGLHKRARGSTESIDLTHVPPTKVPAGIRDCEGSKDSTVVENMETTTEAIVTPSDFDPVASRTDVPYREMKTEKSLEDSVAGPPRKPVASGSVVRSGSGYVASGKNASFIKPIPRFKTKVPRPGSPREPISAPRRITLQNRVGKGQSTPGTRPKHN